MTKKYDVSVFIGRFQPFHNAHLEIIKRALEISNRVIILIGSANQPRTYKNPFKSDERDILIRETLRANGIYPFQVSIAPIMDNIYDDLAWAVDVQQTVKAIARTETNIAIIGHEKDDTSFYLRMFPQWTFVPVESIEPLNATDIRSLYFREDVNMNFFKNIVPPRVLDWMEMFSKSGNFQQIIRERKFMEDYKKQYANFPYPPTFVTADAVVFCQAHVLLVKRKAEPGKGLWALPGGFLNANTDKSLKAAMIRELKEETSIKISDSVLERTIVDNHVFDAIDRSGRGRTITHAYKIVLNDNPLPKVKGSDDAELAKWIPVGELDSSLMFEDHYHIINYFK